MFLKYNWIILFLFFPLLVIAQGETSNWYFGNRAGLQFQNDGSVQALTDGQIDTFEGCATISDSFGDLLFYTDGITVYNRNHRVMENGNNLYGDPSSAQSAIIVPKPEDPEKLYIFTVDTSSFEGDPNRGLNYSLVDMSLDGGNGAVIEKNIRLLNSCSEKITAVVKDCFDQSIWVMTFSTENGSVGPYNTYHAFEINATGVQTTAVKSGFELEINDPRGYMKFNAEGTKLASANSFGGLYIYDFDKETGIVSNQVSLVINGENIFSYGVEFSPNQQFLYVHSSNGAPADESGVHSSSLVQFDVLASDIAASQVIIDERPIYRGALQLGSDGRIYRTIANNYFNGTPFLGAIENPDEAGTAANYQHNAISLNGRNGTQGLPPFIQSFFDKTSLIQNADGTKSNTLTICEGERFILETDVIAGATYNWEKDGLPIANSGASLEVNPANLLDAGRYSLEIILPDLNTCPIIGEALISVNELPETPRATLSQCDLDETNSEDGITTFNLEQIVIDDDTYFFYETFTDAENDNFIQQPVGYTNITPFNTTIYYKKVNEYDCESIGELNLEVIPTLTSDSSKRTLYACDENPNDLILSGNFNLLEAINTNTLENFEVSFYDSRQNASIENEAIASTINTEPTIIYVRIENDNQCVNVLEITLVVNPTPQLDYPNEILLCTDGPPITILAPEGFDLYRWTQLETNATIELSDTAELEITTTGVYELEVGYSYVLQGETYICTNTERFEVLPSNRAVINDINIQDFSDNNTVEVLVSGDGDYEFSIDGITYQDSNTFTNVIPGIFTVYVRDKNDCGITEDLISVVGYPKFFTPNGDGIHDFWQLIGLNSEFQPNSTISIFNRYGSLVAAFDANSSGWDGTYNNTTLPEADYWFKTVLEDGRVFKGHFALKR
ncbi:T9SS type B sorting domain-containing protein [uncultured Croceitalea sp.]|uniref:T9SS type B sorting domain-containing protein n=1 Tax=uncultured Croceitalea sp. TaxID=1798908 RepID=UPI003305F657